MGRTTEARKSEYVSIPLDRKTKRRLKNIASAKQPPQKHTELARGYLVEGIERDEKKMPALATA